MQSSEEGVYLENPKDIIYGHYSDLMYILMCYLSEQMGEIVTFHCLMLDAIVSGQES